MRKLAIMSKAKKQNEKGSEKLDSETLSIVKQHNRNIARLKMQEAVALRQRLEIWKSEKKGKKSQEPKKVPFVTTVLKPTQTETKPRVEALQSKPVKAPNKPTACAPSKTTTATSRRDCTNKPVQKGTRGNFTRPQLASKRPALKDKEKENKIVRRKPSPDKKQLTKSKGSLPPKAPSHTSHTKTPLSRNTGVGKRYVIASLTQREGREGQVTRPLTLAEELKAASGAEVSHSHDDKLPSSQTKSSPAPANSSAATNTSTTRDSLTARFRKSKHHAHTGKLSSVPRAGTSNQRVVSAVKKVASHTKIRSTTSHVVSNPSKSILKQSCHFKARASSTVGASPVLAVSSSHRSRKRSADAAGLHGAAHGKGEEKQQTAGSVTPGHVTFVAETGGAGEEKTAFRKTPGKSRAEDYMREKLNEWLAARGRTPTSLRHAGCFHSERRTQTPRSQVKASLSMEQLSKQETALAREETQRASASSALSSTFVCSTPSRSPHHSTPSQPSQQDQVPEAADDETNVEDAKRMEEPMEEGGCHGLSVPADGAGQTDRAGQLDQDYTKCLAALQSGVLSAEEAIQWLHEVREACSAVQQQVGWYRCWVAAVKTTADQEALLNIFEQAIINKAQPAEEMAQLLTDTMREMLSTQTHTGCAHKSTTAMTAKHSAGSAKGPRSSPHKEDVCVGNMFESTAVKYTVFEVTPFKKRRRTSETGDSKVPVITPVRRSARLSASRPTAPPSQGRPAPGTPYITEYSVLEEVPSAEKEQMLFQPNQALEPLLQGTSPEAEQLSMDMGE